MCALTMIVEGIKWVGDNFVGFFLEGLKIMR